jgi:hypothetical protein
MSDSHVIAFSPNDADASSRGLRYGTPHRQLPMSEIESRFAKCRVFHCKCWCSPWTLSGYSLRLAVGNFDDLRVDGNFEPG